jgi:hypothetical protein
MGTGSDFLRDGAMPDECEYLRKHSVDGTMEKELKSKAVHV